MATDISEEIRRQVAERANRQCEYCLISEEDSGFHHQVDHIVSRKHGGASSLENLALACVLCNVSFRLRNPEARTILPHRFWVTIQVWG